MISIALIFTYLFAGFFWCGMSISSEQLKKIDEDGFSNELYITLSAIIWPFLLMLKAGRDFNSWLNRKPEEKQMNIEEHLISKDQ